MLAKDENIVINDKNIVIRCIGENDIDTMTVFDNTIIHESNYIVFDDYSSFTITKREHEYRSLIMNYLFSKKSLLLGAFIDSTLIAECYFGPVNDSDHRASIEVVVLKQYQNIGVATALFNKAFARLKVCKIEQVEAMVVKENEYGIKLMNRFGFKVCGTIPHAIKINEMSYYDGLYFVKDLR